jgi:acyl carrier protein
MPDTMIQTEKIREQIRTYIAEHLLPAGSEPLQDEEDLLSRLDSLQILRMLIEFESLYQFKIDNSEMSAENLGSIDRLSSFVARKLS